MELLFDTSKASTSTELKDLLGFVDADLNLKNLVPYLISATNDLIDLVGKEVYNKSISAYSSGTISDENAPFVHAMRYPIAVNAYRLFVVSNDLAHTNNGRKMRQDESEKPAFEWMIERDNVAQERRYYRALDDLIKFLDNSKIETETTETLYTIWTSSDAFKATNNLFIRTVAEFDRYFPINSRLLLQKLTPGIFDCEQYEIRPRIGTEKMSILKTALKESTVITDEKDLELLRLIRQACSFYALAWSMPRLSVQLYPEGVLQFQISSFTNTRAATPSLKNEVETARQAFAADAQKALIEIEKLLEPPLTPDQTVQITPNQIYGDKYFST